VSVLSTRKLEHVKYRTIQQDCLVFLAKVVNKPLEKPGKVSNACIFAEMSSAKIGAHARLGDGGCDHVPEGLTLQLPV